MVEVKTRSGFTLIELLVTIAIIGILASVAMVSLSSIRVKARDTKRLADIKQIQLALELYYDNNNIYPVAITSGYSLRDVTNIYMSPVPYNPLPSDGNCLADRNYIYQQTDNGASYTLSFCLGGSLPNRSMGTYIATPLGVNYPHNTDVEIPPPDNEEIPVPDFVCGDELSYSGENYPTVQINNQCWFKKNLNIGSRIASSLDQADANGEVIQKYCYNDLDAKCLTEGGLYQWHTVMALAQVCDDHALDSTCVINEPHQGICPIGWHVPSDNDWRMLYEYINGGVSCGTTGCTDGGQKLKSSPTAWDGDNSSNFSALPTGYLGKQRDFSKEVNRAFFWSASNYDNLNAYFINLNNGNSKIDRDADKKIYGLSTRCLKD